MQKLQSLAIAGAAAIGLALTAFQPAQAAFLQICDAPVCGSPDPLITFNVNDFEGGFTVNGATIQSGLGNPVSVPFDEGSAPTTINGSGVFNFSGAWLDLGQTTATNQTIFLTEDYTGSGPIVSDVLHFTYSTDGTFGHLDGIVISDLEDNLTIADLNAAGIFATQMIAEFPGNIPGGYLIDFSNAFITATFISDVPEPASLALLGGSLVAFGVFRRRRRSQQS